MTTKKPRTGNCVICKQHVPAHECPALPYPIVCGKCQRERQTRSASK